MNPDRLKAVLSANIKRLRDQRGMTQEQLAEAIEKSTEAVSMFERGKTSPSVETLALMANALDVPIANIFVDAPPGDHRADLITQAETILDDLSDSQLETAVKMLAVLREGLKRQT